MLGRTLAFAALAASVQSPITAPAQALQEPRTRTYYLAAEELDWDYAPSGMNQIEGRTLGPAEAVFLEPGPHRIGRVYTKALYRTYTDSTFTTPAAVPAEWAHLGALGPVLRATVGDTIRVVFRNRTRFSFSVHPHGVFYEKDSEGAGSADGTTGADTIDDVVPAGGAHTYVWPVPERAGPGPDDPSSVAWLYHSHVDSPGDTNAGLIGTILVTSRNRARPDATPIDVDREFVILFKIYDENQSPYLEENLRAHAGDPDAVGTAEEEFVEGNLLHTVNGLVYGNLPKPTMRAGERVRWYILGLGNEADLHTVHWHGNTGIENGQRMDTLGLLPGESLEVDMVPDNPGQWLLHCHVDDHIRGGMQAFYEVLPHR